jgi:hypothetical protein
MSQISEQEIERRLSEVNGLSKRNSSVALADNPVFLHLQQHGSIRSDNPLLAKVNPKYPTDAVWTALAVNKRRELAVMGLYISSEGRKPTIYRLRAIPSVAAKQPQAATATATATPVKP